MSRARLYDILIIVLLIAGWVFPKITPPDGVVFYILGAGPPADYYWRYICIGEAGFFSRGVMVEDTWEGFHGHTFYVPSPQGYLQGISSPLFGVATIFRIASGKSRVFVWSLLWILPASLGILTSSWRSGSTVPWDAALLWLVFSSFAVYLMRLSRRLQHLSSAQRWDLLAARSLLFYPLWVLALALTQGVYPFIGLAFTFAGCLLLAKRDGEGH